MAISDTLHTLRLRNFFARTFVPRYHTLTSAASNTRLVIMLWAPHSTDEWSIFCKQVFNELERLGHAVFYSEQLGVSSAMRSKKGVEYKATDTLDLILAVQTQYAPVGDVPDFAEFLVADSKMFLFIDQAASDQSLYASAVAALAARYHNTETFKIPDDFAQGTLLNKIIAKVSVMQMVKYRAIHYGKTWGLAGAPDLTPPEVYQVPRSCRYNLLELYRQHCDELETLLDSTTLFILAYTDHVGGKLTARTLWQDMKLEAAQMQPRMARLLDGKLLAETNGNIVVTELGKQLLKEVGL